MIQHLITRDGVALCAAMQIPTSKETLTPYPVEGHRCSQCNAVRRNIPKTRRTESTLEQLRPSVGVGR